MVRCLGVTKRFPVRGWIPGRPRAHVIALDGIDLCVAAGSVHGLIGPNGSGKSTLLRILATLVLPTTGSAVLGGVDVAAHPLEARRRIGLSTGEERSHYWRLTGRQNLEFYAALFRLPRPRLRIDAVIAELELGDAADRPAGGYSQGMLRRLGLARAVLHEPAVLLLDEPARSLDPLARQRFHELVLGMRDRLGTTVLIATHDLAEAAEICDAVSVLSHGRNVRDVTRADASTLLATLTETA